MIKSAKSIFYNVYFVSFFLGSLFITFAAPQAKAEETKFFPETNHTVSGKFYQYWQANGGLAVFGFPITDAQNEVDPETGKTFLTQWFERNRFELHPENAGTKYEVLLGLLGKDLRREALTVDPAFQRTSSQGNNNNLFFIETGHNLNGKFLDYWRSNGGLERFGFPISEAQREVDPETGKVFVMQWFERARFELHPENTTPYDVLLGLLGNQIKLPKSKIELSWKILGDKDAWQYLAIDSQDHLYAANHNRISQFASNGELLSTWEIGTNSICAISIRNDILYIRDMQGSIFKFGNNGQLLNKLSLPAPGDSLDSCAMAIDDQGTFYIQVDSQISVYDSSGNLLRSWRPNSENLSLVGIQAIAVNRQRAVYIAMEGIDTNSGSYGEFLPVITKLQKYSQQGIFIPNYNENELGKVVSFAIDNQGNIFQSSGSTTDADYGYSDAGKINPAGDLIFSWGDYKNRKIDDPGSDGQVVMPTGIALDNQGNVFIADILYKEAGSDIHYARIQKFRQR
ncbi:MAG: hypothetical protein BGO39_20820 [Chloroflexi bacterium 54-19]|nr:MAG: hypothetical protein BGO39_20820 [Chloroflexi bacterium 54-19]